MCIKINTCIFSHILSLRVLKTNVIFALKVNLLLGNKYNRKKNLFPYPPVILCKNCICHIEYYV